MLVTFTEHANEKVHRNLFVEVHFSEERSLVTCIMIRILHETNMARKQATLEKRKKHT